MSKDQEVLVRIGGWLSAALEDPNVCAEMKRDAADFLECFTPTQESFAKAVAYKSRAETLRDIVVRDRAVISLCSLLKRSKEAILQGIDDQFKGQLLDDIAKALDSHGSKSQDLWKDAYDLLKAKFDEREALMVRMVEALSAFKIRICFIGHPNEPRDERGDPSWQKEIRLLEDALFPKSHRTITILEENLYRSEADLLYRDAYIAFLREALGAGSKLMEYFPPTHNFQSGSDAEALQRAAMQVMERVRDAYDRVPADIGDSFRKAISRIEWLFENSRGKVSDNDLTEVRQLIAVLRGRK